MYNHDMLMLAIKAFLPLVKKMISEVKLDHLRFNYGTNGIYIHKLNENGSLFRVEIPFDVPELPEQT